MSKHRFIIPILLLMSSLPAGITTQAQSIDDREGTATVSGRVTISGKPAHGMTVFLQPHRMNDFATAGAIASAVTDENGHFRITGLPAGTYTAMPEAPGYILPGTESFAMMPQGRTLKLYDGQIIVKFDLELKRGSVITGRVTGINGRPLIGEPIQLMKLDNTGNPKQFHFGPLHNHLTTDDRGVYRIYGLPEGRYILKVMYSAGKGESRINLNIQQTYHPDVTDQSKAKVIDLGEGVEATGVDIYAGEARKTHSIIGRVVRAENGQPVDGAAVDLNTISPDGGMRSVGWSVGLPTKSQGEFHIKDLPPGKYAVFTSVFRTNHDGSYYIADYYSKPVICEIRDNDIQGIEIKVRKGGSIKGALAIQGMKDPAEAGKFPKFTIVIRDLEGRPNALIGRFPNYVEIDSNGDFQLLGIPPGEYDLRLSINPYYPVAIDPQLMQKIPLVKQKVLVKGTEEQSVRLSLDLSPEGNKR